VLLLLGAVAVALLAGLVATGAAEALLLALRDGLDAVGSAWEGLRR
jgi:hypothetical protein